MVLATFRKLFSPAGELDRRAYLSWGLGLFVVKYLLDRVLYMSLEGQAWYPTDYLRFYAWLTIRCTVSRSLMRSSGRLG